MCGRSISDEDPERSGRTEAALEELEDAEEEKANMEEVEDLLEYYLQRATTTQSEAQRLLDGARDLEESISVSLSARRFEVSSMSAYLSCYTEILIMAMSVPLLLLLILLIAVLVVPGTVCLDASASPATSFFQRGRVSVYF